MARIGAIWPENGGLDVAGLCPPPWAGRHAGLPTPTQKWPPTRPPHAQNYSCTLVFGWCGSAAAASLSRTVGPTLLLASAQWH